ncbi:MAG: ECF transporter S component [Candidatus Heimdallarchaeaceae archaeon]
MHKEEDFKAKIIKEVNSIKGITLIVTFTGLVFLSTSIFYLAIASSQGFFNLGEAFVYLSALIGGPITGAIAGGLGSALADIALGYGIFAPATFILKAAEGFVVGFLFYKSMRIKQWIKYLALGIISLFLIGFSAYFINQPFDIGTSLYGKKDITLSIPGYVLFIVAIVLCTLLVLVMFLLKEKGEMAISCSLAGLIIIAGYFFYETVVLHIPVALAAIEIPFNIAQVFFGAAIAIPIVSYLRELGAIEGKTEELEEQELAK